MALQSPWHGYVDEAKRAEGASSATPCPTSGAPRGLASAAAYLLYTEVSASSARLSWGVLSGWGCPDRACDFWILASSLYQLRVYNYAPGMTETGDLWQWPRQWICDNG
eukprot:1037152-Pelagomonas_calceolata.AAC.1